jgi:phospholipid-binding lipoprotein MlaA
MSSRLASSLLLAAALSGCAGVAPPAGAPHPKDPYEALNRRMFVFNERLDAKVLKPAAQTYQSVVPSPVREGVRNFFGNLGDAWSAVNWLLQGDVHRGFEQGARFAWNSTLGLAGVFDVSSWMGLDKRSQDFGQTLGAWGVGAGPYLVLPVFGPSSVRDAAALPVNSMGGSGWWFDGERTQIALRALDVISLRADLLKAGDLVDGIALDKYTFFRDAYLQRRGGKRQKPVDDDDFEVLPSPSPASAPPATP